MHHSKPTIMTDSRKTKNIFIIVTNRCNLRCVYCYEQGKYTASTNLATMKQVLEKEMQDMEFDSFDIVFHGGEPFLEWSLICELSEWLWKNYSHRHLRLMATTNGTLLNGEMKSWLTENRERFALILSLDGGRETHNRNRCNSFDRIDFDFFLRNWPRQRVKMTVNPDALPNMYNDILAIRDIGFLVNPSLAMEVPWNTEIAAPVFADQLELLIGYYLDHPDLEPCSMVDLSPALLVNTANIPRNRACGAGFNIVAYDMYGHRYPCHSFISDFSREYDKEKIEQLFCDLNCKNGLELSPGCKDCFIYPHCEPCYGMNFSHRGDMGRFDPAVCVFTKIRVKAAASMYTRMLVSDKDYCLLRKLSDETKRNIILGIDNIQKHII